MNQDLFADFQRLIAQTSGADPAHASIELLLLQMEPASADQLRLCAIPHQFDLGVFQALVPHFDCGEAEARYREFSRLSFVAVREKALALHDEVRRYLFGRWLARTDVRFQEANARLAGYFERNGANLSGYALEFTERQRMFHMIGADEAQGIAEFERLFRRERKRGRLTECEGLITLAREYDAVLTDSNRGILLYHEGRLWFGRRDWRRAETLFEEVLKNEALAKPYHVKALDRIGLVLAEERRWSDAISMLQKAIKLAEAIDDWHQLPMLLHDLGAAYRDSGNREEAKRVLQRSTMLAGRVHDASCLAAAYNSLGTLARMNQDFQEAIEYYNKSLSHLSGLEDEQLRTAQVYNNLGAVYADKGYWSASKRMYEKSLELKKAAGDTLGQAKTLTNLVPVYKNLSSLPGYSTWRAVHEAIAAAEQAVAIFGQLREVHSAAVATRNLATLYRRLGDKGSSIKNYDRAIELFRQCQDEEEADTTQEVLGAYLRPPGMPWWAWTMIAGCLLPVLAFLLIIIYYVIKQVR